MLPFLENSPNSPDDWKLWAFHHRDSHDRIRSAIHKKYNVSLVDYQVEPINPDDFQFFLQNNASLHGDMNGILGLQSTDILDADLSKPNELTAWILLHYQEHLYAELALGV